MLFRSKDMIMTYILPILSGILTAVSFSSPYLSYIVFIALIPVFLCNDAKKVSRNIALFSFSYHCILMIWLYRLGSAWSPIIITILIILIAIIMSFVYWLPFFILKPKSVISYLCTFLLAEFATTLFGSLSFPWGRLGTILGSHSSLIQMASITGTFGLTLFILSINMLFVIAIKQRKFFY